MNLHGFPPIAWTHTLFTGGYSFRKSNGKIDVEAMAHLLEAHVKQNFWNDKNDTSAQEVTASPSEFV